MKFIYTTLLLLCLGTFVQVNAKNAPAKEAVITGQVCENIQGKNQPVPFANVLCKGTTVGTFAGMEGNFTLDLAEGKHTIIVSCVGYEPVTKTIKVRKNKTTDLFNIQLKPVSSQTALKE